MTSTGLAAQGDAAAEPRPTGLPPLPKDAATLDWLLEGVPHAAIEALDGEERRFTHGEIVFREGDAPDGLYLVVSGRARIVTRTPSGEILLATAGPGEWFGEMGVLDGSPRSATVVAASFLVLRYLPTAPFLNLLNQTPSVALRLLALFNDRLRRANRMLSEFPSTVRRVRHDPS